MSQMSSEWDIEVLDRDAYLDRVGRPVSSVAAADAATLAALHRAHLRHIPFENVDVLLGRTVSVELVDVQAKLVTAGRGGYCYEHGILFAAVLERFGFQVDRRLARIGGDLDRPRARTHMMLDVTDLDGQRWLADVGFGSGLLQPMPLVSGARSRQGVWQYRLRGDDTIGWQLQLAEDDGSWTAQYGFDTVQQHLADIAMSNHYTQTWPSSPFVQRLVVVRKDEASIVRLLGRELQIARPGQPDQVRVLHDDEMAPTLLDFGLRLSEDLVYAILESQPTIGTTGSVARP